MELREVLSALISGGAGVVVYWLMENIRWLADLRPDLKRYASLGLAMAIPVAAWLIMVLLGYMPAPATWQGWIEAIFAMATGTLVVSQGLHGALKLGK